MKRFIYLMPLFLLSMAWVSTQGCRTVATPSFPVVPTNSPTFTLVFTNTPVFTSTPTNTPTQTFTRTSTRTPTNSFTPTITNTPGGPTDTFTFTPTITNTPTNSPTNSPTNTPSSTPTAGACPVALAAPYNFTSNIGCWITNNVLTTTTADWAAAPPAGSISGGGAFHANVTYSASAQLTEEFEVPLPANTDLTGKTISFNIYIDSSVQGTAWGGGIQTYVKTGSLYTFCNQPWVNISGFGGWYTYVLDGTAGCSGLADTRAIGVQVIIAAGGSSGNIYIDDVTVTTPVPPTSTPTPTGLGWNFEDGTAQYWAAVASSGTATGAVTAFGDASTYGFNILIPDGVTTGAANDFRAVCTAASGSPVIGSGMNWTTLALSSVTMRYYVSAAIGSYASTLYPYVIAGSGPTTYGGTYNGWTAQCGPSSCPYVAASAWQTVTFTPSGGSWATDKTNVTAVGVDLNLNAPVTLTNGYYVIDNITLQ